MNENDTNKSQERVKLPIERTIVIHQSEGNEFCVSAGNRLRDRLTSDETLWIIANLLMGREPSYGLETIEEIRNQAEAYGRRKAIRESRPCDRLLTDKEIPI